MKTLNKLFGAALVTSLLFSCNDDFLEAEPTEFVSSSQITEYSDINPELQAASIRGMYTLMYKTGTGGTTGHTDYGQKGYDVYGDILSGDMVLGGLNYGWYSGISNLTSTVDYNSTDNYQPWRYYYRLVFAANAIIDQLSGNDALPEDDKLKIYYAQAKFFRGMSYFYLMNYYTEGYAPGTDGIPYYDEATEAKPPMEQEELYGHIIDDLEQATDLLDGYTRDAKNEINQDVAESYLAYAYAAIGNDPKTELHSGNVIDRANHPLLTADEVSGLDAGFNDADTAAWIWGMDITTDQGLDLISWNGQVDIFTYGYASLGDVKSINYDFWEDLDTDHPNDVRAAQFEKPSTYGVPASDIQRVAAMKFFTPERDPRGQRIITTDYIYLRMAEMYLLNAEANANLGNDGPAKQSLKDVVSLRFDDPTDASFIDMLGGQDLSEEISRQTRIELWGEGKSYLEMKRTQRTIELPSNHLTNAGESYPYNADELTFEIPIQEIQNNPFY